jgi:hypothetical protein
VGAIRTIITVLLLTASLVSATKVTGDARVTIVWRKNAIVSAFTDGFLCYGVKDRAQWNATVPYHSLRTRRFSDSNQTSPGAY